MGDFYNKQEMDTVIQILDDYMTTNYDYNNQIEDEMVRVAYSKIALPPEDESVSIEVILFSAGPLTVRLNATVPLGEAFIGIYQGDEHMLPIPVYRGTDLYDMVETYLERVLDKISR